LGVTQRQSLAILLAQLGISLAVLIAATVLAAMGVLDGEAVVALFGAAIGGVASGSATLGHSAINGGPKPDLNTLAASHPDVAARLSSGQRQEPGPTGTAETEQG
jgi:hypothetical protein